MINEDLLYHIIYKCISKEDKELSLLADSGIFFAPELYVAFILGKEIKGNELGIFGRPVTWIRETNLKNGGLTDFVFETKEKDQFFVFEVKLRGTHHAYDADINKLKNLKGSRYIRYFVALIDAWKKDRENDGRIIEIEKRHPDLKRVSKFMSFDTKQTRYVGEIYCTLGIWRVNNS